MLNGESKLGLARVLTGGKSMEFVVSIIGIVLCLRDRKRLRFFLISFIFLFSNMVYMFVVTRSGGVMETLHMIGYDSMSGVFSLIAYWIPLVFNLGFYGFLLLGIKNLRSLSSNE